MADTGPLGYDDLFSTAIQGIPTTSDRQLALAQSLRAQNLLGNIGLATGDRVIGPEGKSLIGQADTGIQDIAKERNEDLQRKQLQEYHDAMLKQRDELGRLYEQGRNDRDTANNTTKMDIAELNAKARNTVLNNKLQFTNDKEVNTYLSDMYDITGVIPTGSMQKLQPIIRAELDKWKDKFPDADYYDIASMAAGNKMRLVNEQRRQSALGGIAGKTEQSAAELPVLGPQLQHDIENLGNTQIRSLNWLLNVGRDQLNDPALAKLQADIQKFEQAYNGTAGRNGTSMQERLLQMELLRPSHNAASMKATIDALMDESRVALRANKEAGAPRVPGVPGMGGAGASIPGVGGVPPPGNGFTPFAPGSQIQTRPPVQPGGAPGPSPAPGEQLRPDDLAPAGPAGAPGVAPQRALPNAVRQPSPQPAPAPPPGGMPPGGAQPQGAFPNTLGRQAPPPQQGAPPAQGAQPPAGAAIMQAVKQRLATHGITDITKATDAQLMSLRDLLGKSTLGANDQDNAVMKIENWTVDQEMQRRAQMKQKVQKDAEAFYH